MYVACVAAELLLTVVTRAKIDIFYFTEFSPPLQCRYLVMQCVSRYKGGASSILPCIYNALWCVHCDSMHSRRRVVCTLLSFSSILFLSSVPPFPHYRVIDTCSLHASFFSLMPRIKCAQVCLQEKVWIWFGWRLAFRQHWTVSGGQHEHHKVCNHNTEKNSTSSLCIHWDFCLSEMEHSPELVGQYHRQKQKPRAQNFDASS